MQQCHTQIQLLSLNFRAVKLIVSCLISIIITIIEMIINLRSNIIKYL
jgi:hypothetical protein